MSKIDKIATIHRLTPEESLFFENKAAEINSLLEKMETRYEEIIKASNLDGEWEICEDFKWLRKKGKLGV